MSTFRPTDAWGLHVPPNDDPQPAVEGMSGQIGTIRLTMAAIDPGENYKENTGVDNSMKQRATLKMIIIPSPDDDSDDEDDDEFEDGINVADLLGDDEEEDSDDEEANGGPSNPEKSPKARKREQLKKALAEANRDDDGMDVDGVNGIVDKKVKSKGKERAMGSSSGSEEDSDDEEMPGAEEYVLCTLDPDHHYQQPLDITIPENQPVLFTVNGTHSIYLTGNMGLPQAHPGLGPVAYDSEDEDEEMDLSPDEDELDLPENETSEDELDDLDDPRIEELATSDDEEIDAPKLVPSKSEPKKGKNKRAADATPEETPEKPTPDSILAKSLKPATDAKANGEQQPQLSKNQLKKQRKKMKDTAGNAVEVANLRQEDSTDKGVKASVAEISKTSPGGKPDKKVQFASTLVQGPSSGSNPSPDGARAQTTTAKLEGKKSTGDDAKPASGPRVVQGVTVDDRKTGTGQQAKKGNQVSMRYIGKLADTKRVFDSNKKGAPFTFKLGAGEVIKGWDVGVSGMAVGGERRITIPAALAYGAKGAGKDIPPNATLVFDVKVLDIK